MSLLAAAACGGGGGDDRLSGEELISQADAICVKYLKDGAALGVPESVEEVGEWAAANKRIFERVLTELRALEPPEGLADEYDELISSNEEQRDLLGELARAGAEGARGRVVEIAEEGNRRESGNRRLAKQVGLRDCEQYGFFEGDGYSLAHPWNWDRREGEASVQAGATRCSRTAYLGPRQGTDGLSINVCRLRDVATEENIDELLDSLAAEVEQTYQGWITRAPMRVTVDGLPALRFHATVFTPDDVPLEARFLILFKRATRFSLTCQFRSENAAKMKHACDVAFASFQVH
jgi:hypothetical protein